MKVNNFMDVLGLIVILAIVTDIVTGKNTASVISHSASGFSEVLRSAQGK
jgi:hypothetical protein